MIDVVAAKRAVRDWVVAASEIPRARVVWSGQDGPPPDGGDVALSIRLTPLQAVGRDWVTYQRNLLGFAARAYTISGGALLAAAHALTTGDGPFQLLGAVVGTYWVIVLDTDRLALASSFDAARAGSPIVLPPSGAGEIDGPEAVPALAPGRRTVAGHRIYQLVIEARGGSPTGGGEPWVPLERLRDSVDLLGSQAALAAAGVRFGVRGAVQAPPPELINKANLRPYATWSCEIHAISARSEVVGVIATLADPTITVL